MWADWEKLRHCNTSKVKPVHLPLTGVSGRPGRTVDRPSPRWGCTRWAWTSRCPKSTRGRRAFHSCPAASSARCTWGRDRAAVAHQTGATVANAKGCWSERKCSAARTKEYSSSSTVTSESVLSLVQGIAAGFVTFHHAQHLHILREEAGRQQAVDAQLQTLLQREGHPLQGGRATVTQHVTVNQRSESAVSTARGQLRGGRMLWGDHFYHLLSVC